MEEGFEKRLAPKHKMLLERLIDQGWKLVSIGPVEPPSWNTQNEWLIESLTINRGLRIRLRFYLESGPFELGDYMAAISIDSEELFDESLWFDGRKFELRLNQFTHGLGLFRMNKVHPRKV